MQRIGTLEKQLAVPQLGSKNQLETYVTRQKSEDGNGEGRKRKKGKDDEEGRSKEGGKDKKTLRMKTKEGEMAKE